MGSILLVVVGASYLAHHFGFSYSLGAFVEVEREDGIKLTQQFTSGEGMSSDQAHELIFGLGDKSGAKKILVTYADGKTLELGSQKANTTLNVKP